MSSIAALQDSADQIYSSLCESVKLNAAGCKPIPYKGANVPDTDPGTLLCLLSIYTAYLLKLIDCENLLADPSECCEAAGKDYCDAHARCVSRDDQAMPILVAALWPPAL